MGLLCQTSLVLLYLALRPKYVHYHCLQKARNAHSTFSYANHTSHSSLVAHIMFASLPLFAIIYFIGLSSATPLIPQSQPSNVLERGANVPVPCDGAGSIYLLRLPPPKAEAQVLPHEALPLINDMARYLSDKGGDLGGHEAKDDGTVFLELGARPDSPYPPNTVPATQDEMYKRAVDAVAVSGRPIPIHIKNEDVANCLDELWNYVNTTPWAVETDIEIVHAPTGRLVADGDLEVHDAKVSA